MSSVLKKADKLNLSLSLSPWSLLVVVSFHGPTRWSSHPECVATLFVNIDYSKKCSGMVYSSRKQGSVLIFENSGYIMDIEISDNWYPTSEGVTFQP